ncbi:MAG: hypothetical protein HY978_01555 [Candidatus Liptonbacteria bacterium]|nr:hypothetical protein [Candidatus Liptonbacteria bacterium]
MNSTLRFAGLLGVAPELVARLDQIMSRATGRTGVLDAAAASLEGLVTRASSDLKRSISAAASFRTVLADRALRNEAAVLGYLAAQPGRDQFQQAINLAREAARVPPGFFLRKDRAADILRQRPPEHVLSFLKLASIEELLAEHDVAEVMSVLRFMETEEWMHQTFESAYSGFRAADFEEREIEIAVLGPIWREVALEYTRKKHHNVSHLKEFGVIFLNPIQEDSPGKFLRDFALLLHYFHEIDFYAKLFRQYAAAPDFSSRLKSLLRGDVPERTSLDPGEWLIVQRYLAKINPQDPRLFLPRVNPESRHWRLAERDLAAYARLHPGLGLEFWDDLDWVGWRVADSLEITSFDLEDNVMSAVARAEGSTEHFSYHQREALWTHLFELYAGGEAQAEKLLLDNFMQGSIRFQK